MEITLEIKDEVALVKLDDGKKNAVDLAALRDLGTALDEADAKAKAIVLAGRPGSFCAGFDLATMTGGDIKMITQLGGGGGRSVLRLFRTPKPTVAACTGHAFTIGALWLLACDTRIGEAGPFKFGMTETKMGMALPGWALEPLKARINPTHFLPVVTQSKTYDPEGAVTCGFLDEVVPQGRAIDAALEAAAGYAALPAQAYADNKLSTRQEAIAIMGRELGE